MDEKVKVIHGGGNVFADLGLPDAEMHTLKADLALRMMRVIRNRKLTEARAAEIMGLKQPDVSNLIRGRFRGFSVERLLLLLGALHQDIDIIIRDKPKSKRAARLVIRGAA